MSKPHENELKTKAGPTVATLFIKKSHDERLKRSCFSVRRRSELIVINSTSDFSNISRQSYKNKLPRSTQLNFCWCFLIFRSFNLKISGSGKKNCFRSSIVRFISNAFRNETKACDCQQGAAPFHVLPDIGSEKD